MYSEKQIYNNLSTLQGYNRQEFVYNQVIQCVFPYAKLKDLDWITDDFVGKYGINEDTIIGAESIPANSHLEAHTDIIRRSNLLINVGENTAYVQHSNNGTLEEVAIEPGESFLINTKVLHGSNNKTDKAFEFLTINTRQAYQTRIDHE
jgi:hypothetical protein